MISLQQRHTFGLRARARHYRRIVEEAQIPGCFQPSQLTWLLGEGSNTVFLEDFEGSVVHLQTKGMAIRSSRDFVFVEVQAGENWHELVVELLNKGIYGLENLALIPGSVGAAPVQNIGAYGAEFSSFCQSVRCYDTNANQWLELSKDDCRFGYRTSIFKEPASSHLVITAVTLKFAKQWHANTQYKGLDDLPGSVSANAIFDRVVAIRRNKLPDPSMLGNAGSFFKNPVIAASLYDQIRMDYPQMPVFPVDEHRVKVPAAFLIDQCGLKGQRWGQIAAHSNQPLVLVNLGEATGSELLFAARHIRDTVQQRFAVVLNNEVRLVGAKGEVSL